MLVPVCEGKRVFFTGHSLGGALAHVAAKYLSCDYRALITFGSPRVFGNRGVAFDKVPWIERYVHGKDMVPTLPPESLGFEHFGTERFLSQQPRPWQHLLVPRGVFDHIPTLYAEALWSEK